MGARSRGAGMRALARAALPMPLGWGERGGGWRGVCVGVFEGAQCAIGAGPWVTRGPVRVAPGGRSAARARGARLRAAMWRLRCASPYAGAGDEGDADGALVTMNAHVGRQVWVWDANAGTPEERVAAEAARKAFADRRHEVKHSADELMRLQRAKGAPPPKAPKLRGSGPAAEAMRSIEHGAAFFGALQDEDGHWCACARAALVCSGAGSRPLSRADRRRARSHAPLPRPQAWRLRRPHVPAAGARNNVPRGWLHGRSAARHAPRRDAAVPAQSPERGRRVRPSHRGPFHHVWHGAVVRQHAATGGAPLGRRVPRRAGVDWRARVRRGGHAIVGQVLAGTAGRV